MNGSAVSNLPNLLSARDVKKYLGCNDANVYALLKQRDFPSFRIGKKYYVDEGKFIEWMSRVSKQRK